MSAKLGVLHMLDDALFLALCIFTCITIAIKKNLVGLPETGVLYSYNYIPDIWLFPTVNEIFDRIQ